MNNEPLTFSIALQRFYQTCEKTEVKQLSISIRVIDMNIDLDPDNYSLDDILGLFHLPPHFSRDELKSARSIALRLHPDKCNLESKYYIFFSKAYNLLVEVLQFREKGKEGVSRNERRGFELDESKIHMLDKLQKKKGFSKWFNQQFEELNLIQKSKGHGDWIKTAPMTDFSTMERNAASEAMQRHKANLRAVVPEDRIGAISERSAGHSMLGNDEEDEIFACDDPFAKLRFEDLRVAHTETVVPVTHEDFDSARSNMSVEALRRSRGTQNVTPMSQQRGEQYLGEQNRRAASSATSRAYQLARQDSANQAKSKEWWSRIQLLEDM